MVSLPQQPTRMTEAEYLIFERESEIKHEYVNGEIFAMSGATENHNLISVNILTILKRQLRGKGCKVYPADMRLRVQATGEYFYPDASVVCEKAQFAEGVFDSLINPILIVEVLSPSTEVYDRGKKFQTYRKMPTLQEYLLVSQDHPQIERYFLNQAGNWELTDVIGLDNTLELLAVECMLEMSEVYDLVVFDIE